MSDMTAKLDNDGAFNIWEWWCVRCADLGSGRDSGIEWMGAGGVGWKGAVPGCWNGTGGGDVFVPAADDHWMDSFGIPAALKPDSESEGNRELTGQF